MEQMIAMCGLDCATCDARLATVALDEAAKARVAAEWRAMFHSDEINEQLSTKLPEDENYDTVGGFVFSAIRD